MVLLNNHTPWVSRRPDGNPGKGPWYRAASTNKVPEQCWRSNLNPAGLSSCPAQNGIRRQHEREKERERERKNKRRERQREGANKTY